MKTKTDPRHQKRVRMFKALYAKKYSQTEPALLDNKDRLLFEDILKNQAQINKQIDSFSIKFGVTKMAKIDLSILQLGVYELLITKKVPKKVVIDECIEIAKEYGGTKSPNLINGILGKLVDSL